MKTIFDFIRGNWESIVVIMVMLSAMTLKLCSLWRGNIIEWLIVVCAECENLLGGGTGFLKLRTAYAQFVEQFPFFAKLVPFETFSVWVDEALAVLKEKLAVNQKLADYVGVSKESEENT